MRKSNGFTLVELAIALMVIGLLIGGVLKGQELIENARITRIAKDITDFETAVMIFRSLYNDEIPGDILNPTLIPDCNTAPCNNLVGVGTYRLDTVIKRENFWRHLYRAKLLPLDDDDGTQFTTGPLNPYNVSYFVYHPSGSDIGKANRRSLNGYTPSRHNFPLKRAVVFDRKFDDGKPLTGIIFNYGYDAPEGVDICHHETTLEYLSDPTLRCGVLYESKSLNF